MKRVLVARCCVASTAQANVWQHAIDTRRAGSAQDVYDSEMKTGDELAMQANARGQLAEERAATSSSWR